jgi:hypothetical protein
MNYSVYLIKINVCKFTVLRPAQEFFNLYGHVTATSEGLKMLAMLSVPTFEQGRIFIVTHLL